MVQKVFKNIFPLQVLACLFALGNATTGPNPILVNTITPTGGNAFITSGPFYINLDSLNRVYATEFAGNLLHVFNQDDSLFSTPVYSLNPLVAGITTGGLGTDSNNNVYISNRATNTVRSFTSVDNGLTVGSSYGTGNRTCKYDRYNNLLYSGLNSNGYIYQNNGGNPNFLNVSFSPASYPLNGGGYSDASFNPVNSMLYVSNTSAATGVEVHNPASNYGYVTTYGSGWGLGVTDLLDVEPISGYLYLTDQASNIHTATFNGNNYNTVGTPLRNVGIKLNNKSGKIYTANYFDYSVSVYFDPFAWSSPGTSYIASLPLNQALTLNAGYNLNIAQGSMGSTTNLGSSPAITAGTLSLNGSSVLTLAGGTLTIGTGLTFNTGTLVDQVNSIITAPITLSGASTVTSQFNNTLTFNGVISGANPLTFNGLGKVVLNGNNTNSGGHALSSGTLTVGSSTALGLGGTLTVSTGSTLEAGTSLTFNNPIVPAYAAWNIDTQFYTLTHSGNMTLNGTQINKIGTGTLTMTGTKTGNGSITVNGGTLSVGTSTGIGNAMITMNSGTTFQVSSSIALGNMISGNGAFTLDTQGNTLTHNSYLSGSGTLTKIGAGTLILNGANNYQGSVNIAGGTIQLAASESWGSFQGSGTLNMGANMILMGKDNTNQTFSGNIIGSGIIHKLGTGTLTLTGDLSAFTGTINVEGGQVILNSTTTFGGTLVNYGILDFKSNSTVTGSITNNGGAVIVG